MPTEAERCIATTAVYRRVEEAFPTGGCPEIPTHQWHTFFLCPRHAEFYNVEYHDSVNYQPINDVERERIRQSWEGPHTTVEPVEPVLIDPQHPGAIINSVCTECGKAVHACGRHDEFGCRRRTSYDNLDRCSLCTPCYRIQRNNGTHTHCNGCRHLAEWLCEECVSCLDCTSGTSRYNSDLCSNCYASREDSSDEDQREQEQSRVIHEYHEYTVPKARPSMDGNGLRNGQPFLWLGVELECEAPRIDKNDAAEAMHAEFGEGSSEPYIIMADDCSLNSGFETITGPMSLNEHKALWPKLAPFMAKQGLRSWAHETTGMHVHISKNFHSQLEIGKMLVFLNSPKNDTQITKLAGRGNSTYTNRYKKKITDHYNGQNGGRYNALNTSNESTNEFRIFKGTLKTGHILANIEFCHALAMYVKNASVRVMEDWPLFWKFVLSNRRDYAHLIEFFSLEVQQAA